MINLIWLFVSAGAALIIGLFIGYVYRKSIAEAKVGRAEDVANQLLQSAQQKAGATRKETIIEAREEIQKLKFDFENELKSRRSEISRGERRLQQKEDSLDKKLNNIEHKEEKLQRIEDNTRMMQEKIQSQYDIQVTELERISGMQRDEAKEMLLSNIEKEIRFDVAKMIRTIEGNAKDEADKLARNIVCLAIQKCAADHVAETTVSVVALPNDEMKGRIIGREGRNIRALETATGIDCIIDDTPEAVILSGFDPIRREIARITLEKLIVDGRIHPARIEEMVAKAKKEVDVKIKEAGEAAVFDVGVHGLHHDLIRIIGRLRYRTSYGQNVLKHSIEVAHLSGLIAAEVGADIRKAKRAGLLHDIGKAVDHETEGPHAKIGADLAKKYREGVSIIHAISAHHGDVEATTLEAMIVQAADAISAARPGARRESLENYVKRLEDLEGIANSHNGVEKSFAIQAGREVRIIVKPDVINDAEAIILARDIAKKIEEDLEYPGQIKVNVIRETRASDIAK